MCAVFGFKPYREVIDDLGASKYSGYRVQKPPYSDILVFNELYDDDEIDRYEKIVRMKQIRSLCTLCVSPFEADREYKLVEKINAKRGV